MDKDLLIVLIGVSNLIGQWYWGNEQRKLYPSTQPTTDMKPFVTPTNPAFVNESKIGQGDSVIVEPKSPQRVAWEEQEQLRKLNIKPR